MVFKRRSFRKSGRKTGRKFGRRPRINRRALALGSPKAKVFYFSRNVLFTNLVAGADGADTFAVYTFGLDDVPGYTEYTAMFDFFKLNGVALNFLPQFNSVVGAQYLTTAATTYSIFGAYTTPSQMRCYSVLDYNDATTPTTIDALRQYANCKVTTYTRGHKRFIKPKLQWDAGTGPVQFGKNPWTSCDTAADTTFYSIKFGIDTSIIDPALIAAGNILMRIEAKYYMSFKSPR